VLGEAIQTLMRREGVPEPYETLKALTRGRRLDAASMRALVAELPLSEESRARLEALTPAGYVGLAAELARAVRP
jgi:adenylosuccinate lyase